MPAEVNSNYSANFQKFVDFANKAYATKGEDTVARFSGMPKGDYRGTFASFLRSSDMKTANDQVRNLFLKTVADMFGGEKFIPDIVRDNMKLEDFGKGKPLTARRNNLVKIAIDTLGGGKFQDAASVGRATSMGYAPAELTKLARAANIYQQATGCTDAEAEAAALDPNSKARRLFDCGGRFTLNADNFKKGLALMDKFAGWYGNLHDDFAAGRLDTPTKRNLQSGVCNRKSGVAVQKFLMEEIAVNSKIPLDAKNPEDAFGMAKNPAMRFVGRGYTMTFANSLAQISPGKRSLLYAVFDAFHKLPAGENMPEKNSEIGQGAVLGARVMKHYDAVAALQAAGKLDRAHLVPILYSELQVSADAGNKEINDAFEAKLMSEENIDIVMPLHTLAMQSGATLDEVAAAIRSGGNVKNAPGISSANGHLDELDGTANGGRATMIGDLHRPAQPTLIKDGTPAIPDGNSKFVFNFPDGATVAAKKGAFESKEVKDSSDAIADKIRDLCGEVHPAQLSNVYFALSQSGIGSNTKRAFEQYGISSDEHMPVTFTLSRNGETGAVTIKYSEPEGMPVKFNWTTTVDVDGKTSTTPMRVDHGQYEAEAMKSVGTLASRMPGKDKASAEALVKDMLAQCGDDFELKEIVSKSIRGICVTAGNKMRSADQIKAGIDAIRANLEEIRNAAAGDAAVEKAGLFLMDGLNGKSLPPGLVGKIVKAASAGNPGEFAKLSATSAPQQMVKAVTDLRTAVETAIYDAKVKDSLEGGDQMLAVRDFAAMLLLAKLSAGQLQGANAAFRSETASKLIAVLDGFGRNDFPAGATVSSGMSGWIAGQSSSLSQLATQYNFNVETMLGKKSGGDIKAFEEPFDTAAFGAKDVFKTVSALAEFDVKADEEKRRRDENVRAGFQAAQANAANAYSKAGEGNADKVKKLIYAALTRCADNGDAVKVVADNMDAILVSSTAKLRSIEQVRERAEAVAANFAELKELSGDNPAVYEAGRRMMAAMGGKALPPGTIGRLVLAASHAKIDAIRKLSSRSSALEIHRACTQLRDNLVQAMNDSGAEAAAGGPDEKQACRNFIAALMMDRCGARSLHAMQGAFGGDTSAKLLALYSAIADGNFNEGVGHEAAIRLEDQAGSHMTHLAILKDAIDLAVEGRPGAGIVPFGDPLDPDEIGGGDIYDDLLNIASR